MADAHAEPKHDYHLLEPSLWPFIGSVSVFVLALGAIFSWHEMAGGWLWIPGMLGVLYTMFVWWKDVVKEAHEGHHKPVVALHQRYGMILFIASEVMFFVAWFWAYFNAAIYPTEFIGGTWPPEGIQTFDPWHLPFINTLILLLSGTTVTWAHHALLEGDRSGLKQGLWCTILLGVLFSCVQAYEYSHAAFGFTDGIYASTFFMATGFHGFHVLVGTIFLAVCLVRAYKGHFRPEQHFGFEAAAWYWHFVDVVWLFLFLVIYIGGQGAGGAH
jgi:cytochrome c oxidase subunit 3